MSKNAITKGILAVATVNTAKIVASALATPLLARLLGAEGYGQYAAYLALIMVATPLANLGTHPILVKHIAERPDDLAWRSRVVAQAGLFNLLGLGLTIALVVLVLWPDPGTGAPGTLTVALVVGVIILDQVWFFARGLFYGLKREELASLPAALGFMGGAILGIALALAGLGLFGVMLGLFSARLVVALVTLNFFRRFLTWNHSLKSLFSLPDSGVIRFGFLSFLLQTLLMALYRVDVLLISQWAGAEAAGLYAAATQWAEFVWVVPLAVQAVMVQTTAPLWVQQQPAEITALLSRLLRYVALITAFLLILVGVLAEPVLQIYFGPAFIPASLPLRILAPGVFSLALARILWPVIQARGQVLSLVVTIATAVVANVALNWFLIPHWGAAGAALASCVCYGSVIFVYARILHKWGVRPFSARLGGRLLLLCVATAAVLTPFALLALPAWLAVSAGGLLGGAVYSLGAWWLGLWQMAELRQMIAALPSPVRRTRWLYLR